MKSKLEIRKFAVEKAVEVMGVGTPSKDVVAKAQEIEIYITGNAELPEVYDSDTAVSYMFSKGFEKVLGTLANVVEKES